MYDETFLQRCACANLRSTTRLVTQFFDTFLQPSGLQITQYSLLTNLAKTESISISQFAQLLDMDRTTLTRNLDPLIRRGLIARTPGHDQRMRMLQITPQGQELLAAARPLWAQAQEQFVAGFGEDRYRAFLGELSAITSIVR